MPGRFGRTSKERNAMLRNQASELCEYGKIETTQAKAKALKSYVEKVITAAVRTYQDTVEEEKTVKDSKGKDVKVKVIKDGAKKLAARRKAMSKLYDLKEIRTKREKKAQYKARTSDVKHPLIEKLFNDIAPKFAERETNLKQGGGYTRIYLTDLRKGDGAQNAIIELVD